LLTASPMRFRQDAVEIAFEIVDGLQFDTAADTERFVKIEVRLQAHRLDVELEQSTQRLDRSDMRQREHVVAKRRLQLAGPVVLGKGVGHRVLAEGCLNSAGS
jgi:hypothetical protein